MRSRETGHGRSAGACSRYPPVCHPERRNFAAGCEMTESKFWKGSGMFAASLSKTDEDNREAIRRGRDLRTVYDTPICTKKYLKVIGMRLLKNVTKAKQTLRRPIADPAARSNRACGFAPLLVRLRTFRSAKLRLRHFATSYKIPPLRMTLRGWFVRAHIECAPTDTQGMRAKSRGTPRLFYVIYLFRHIYDFRAMLHR